MVEKKIAVLDTLNIRNTPDINNQLSGGIY